jgi:riboflavin kinase/FMN adenylyltransferase
LPPHGTLAVFTFSTHPSHLFTPEQPSFLICPPLQKVKHLADYGADLVFLIPFTHEFAKTPFTEFLQHLKRQLNFSQLVLGSGAAFGKNKEGDETHVRKLATELNFVVDYLPKTRVDDIPISSGRIRSLIMQGALHEVQICLGRPYSLMGQLHEKNRFFYFPLPNICLPPEGIYPVRLKANSVTYLARAHILPQEQEIKIDPFQAKTPFHNNVEIIF